MEYGIFRETINKVIDKTSILSLAGEYVQLIQKGGRYWALCPFHSEKTPSFFVNPDKNLFYCFGCCKGGNIINFVEEMEHLSFFESVKLLCQRFNIDYKINPEEKKREIRKTELQEIYKDASWYYFRNLNGNSKRQQDVLRYLKEIRGFSDKIIDEWTLGFATGNGLLEYLTRQKEHSLEAILESGLINKSKSEDGYYEVFYNRIIFPIKDKNGNTIAFAGRSVDDSLPKYINSGDSMLYKKSEVFYGIDKAWNAIKREKMAIIVEGYTDNISIYKNEIDFVLATGGTSITEAHLRQLGTKVKEIVLCSDADEGGIRGSTRASNSALSHGIPVSVMTLEKGMDPDDFLKAYGREKFLERLTYRVSPLEFIIETSGLKEIKRADIKQLEAKNLFPLIDSSRDVSLTAMWLKEIAKILDINPEAVFRDYNSHLRELKRKKPEESLLTNQQRLLGFLVSNKIHRTLARTIITMYDFPNPVESLFYEFITTGEETDDLSTRAHLEVGGLELFEQIEKQDIISAFKKYCEERGEIIHESQLGRLNAVLFSAGENNPSIIDIIKKELITRDLQELEKRIGFETSHGKIPLETLRIYAKKYEEFYRLYNSRNKVRNKENI